MKMNNLGYLLKEGVRSIFSHGLMSFASVCVTVACLIIVGRRFQRRDLFTIIMIFVVMAAAIIPLIAFKVYVNYIGIALCAGADFNIGISKGSLSAITDATAQQNAHGKVSQKACHSFVTAAIGIDNLAGNNLAGLDFVQFEGFSVAEVLENFAVSKRNCNSHG